MSKLPESPPAEQAKDAIEVSLDILYDRMLGNIITLRGIKDAIIFKMVERTNEIKAARALDIGRSTVYRRLRIISDPFTRAAESHPESPEAQFNVAIDTLCTAISRKRLTLKDVESRLVCYALDDHYTKRGAAKQMGIGRSSLYRKIKQAETSISGTAAPAGHDLTIG